MDRLTRTLAGCGLAVLAAASGCRSMRSEVPAGRPYSPDGKQLGTPPVGFSSEPHSIPNNAAGLTPGVVPNATGQFGTPLPNSGNYGAPTNNSYGPPGSSPMGGGGASGPQSLLQNEPSSARTMAPSMGAAPAASGSPEDRTQSPLTNYSP